MKRNPKMLAIGAVGIILIALAVVMVMNVVKQPTTADFERLDTQRQVVDTSMNIYNPLFDQYTSDYANVYAENRSNDEKTALKEDSVNVFKEEQDRNTQRLKDMGSSIAMKDADVKTAFDEFDSAYGKVVSYYEQHAKNIAAITESIAGPCAALSKLNVSVTSFADDYVKAADACLKAIDTAKKTSDGTTKQLLADAAKLIKERRDKFAEISKQDEDFDQKIANLKALISLLDINADIKVAQDKYETQTKTEYTKLVNEANAANDAFKKALSTKVSEA